MKKYYQAYFLYINFKTKGIMKLISKQKLSRLIGVLAFLGLGLQVVQASELTVCVNKKSGVWRPVSNSSKCNKKENFVSLNTQGPQGPQGLKGDTGGFLLLDSNNINIGYFDPYTAKSLITVNEKSYIINGVTKNGFTEQGSFLSQINHFNPAVKLEAASFYSTTDCTGTKYFVHPSIDASTFDNIARYTTVDSQKLYTIDSNKITSLMIYSKYDPSYTLPTCLNQNPGIYGSFQPTTMSVIPASALEFVLDLSTFTPPFSVIAP